MSDVLILAYHAVSQDWPAALSVTPARLERQLRALANAGYRGTTFSTAVFDPPAARTVALTFDDSLRSVYEWAFPILSRHGFPGTVFVPTSFAGSEEPRAWPGVDHWLGGPHERELTPMTWGQLAELAGAGWEIGSHTRTHPRLPELDDAKLRDELVLSRQACEEHLRRRCDSIAYPYGDHDARVVSATGEAGYSAACTLPSPLHAAEPLRWPRIGVYYRDGQARFRLKISPWGRRLRTRRDPQVRR